MNYKIRSSLLPADKSYITGKPIEKPVQETIAMYERGEDLIDSPFIQAGQWRHHMYCFHQGNTIESAYERQEQIVNLYENIKQNGYNGSQLYIWFDRDGFVKLGDGFHRITILHYLNQDALVNCETDWTDMYDNQRHTDFPLVETLLSIKDEPRRGWIYQPVDDPRLRGWKVDRYDAEDRLNYILPRISGKRILDIGCSEGYYARELTKRGYEVTAIDRSRGLVAVARYLTTLANLSVDYHHVNDWSEFSNGRFDTILFLSVIHNDMKRIGIDKGIEKLQLLRDKANVIFMEVPNNHNEKGWGKDPYPKYDFHNPKSIADMENSIGAKVTDRFAGRRVIYMFKNGKEQDTVSAWLTDYRNHYRPLFRTLAEKPCRNIMEIGVFDGTSAVPMIKQAAKLVPENEINFYGFDLFDELTPELRDEEFSFQTNKIPKMDDVAKLLNSDTSANISLHKGNTRYTLEEAIEYLPKMDLIYIDGGHTIETIRNDWHWASQLMKDDTVVYFDDYLEDMPFIGAKFITKELDSKYQYAVMPETDIYARSFGKMKTQLLRVESRRSVVRQVSEHISSTDHYRFHLLGLPHAITRKEETMCAFTQLVYRLSDMLTGLGHEVYHYGTEGSELNCTEHIDVLTQAVQKEAYGKWSSRDQLWIHNGQDLAYRTFRKNAIAEIRKRVQPRDMILISNGSWLRQVSDAFPNIQAVEPIVGYIGYFSNYKVFPSYAWMHHMAGRLCEKRAASERTKSENFAKGAWYDAVIPHFFNPNDFTYQEKKDDYYLYLGRLIRRKGPHIAADMTKRLGAKLVVAGQPLWSGSRLKESLSHVGLLQPHVDYVGTVDMEGRNKLLANARAVIIPSLYFEPFGLVVAEALLCGTPVITTDWGAFPEIVPQGEVGYRCRTMSEFMWAGEHIDSISPKRCRDYAVSNFSMNVVARAYQHYFTMVQDKWHGGWYAEHPERNDLDWLRRY